MGSAPLVGAVRDDVAINIRELEPGRTPPNTEPCSSSHSESIRDERRPDEDEDELRRDAEDKLAIRPRARMAVPVFYTSSHMQHKNKSNTHANRK